MKAQITILLSLLCVVIAEEHYKPHHHKKEHKKPYAFSYGIRDEYSGSKFGQEEKSNGNEVQGTYHVQLPDGRKQTVNYKADHHNGFIADVQYYGKAQYPPKSKIPPFVVKPHHSYHPDPHKHEQKPYH